MPAGPEAVASENVKHGLASRIAWNRRVGDEWHYERTENKRSRSSLPGSMARTKSGVNEQLERASTPGRRVLRQRSGFGGDATKVPAGNMVPRHTWKGYKHPTASQIRRGVSKGGFFSVQPKPSKPVGAGSTKRKRSEGWKVASIAKKYAV